MNTSKLLPALVLFYERKLIGMTYRYFSGMYHEVNYVQLTFHFASLLPKRFHERATVRYLVAVVYRNIRIFKKGTYVGNYCYSRRCQYLRKNWKAGVKKIVISGNVSIYYYIATTDIMVPVRTTKTDDKN